MRVRWLVTRWFAVLLFVLLGTLAVVPPSPVRAVGNVVNTLTDAATGSCATTCTLRDAIALATAGETITFSVSGTITLNQTLGTLNVNQAITIQGPAGAGITVDGGCTNCQIGGAHTTGTLTFFLNFGGTMTISGLTLTHGNGGFGGAIQNFNSGALVVTNCLFFENFATQGAAISSAGGGAVTVTNSTIASNTNGSGSGSIAVRSAALTMTNDTVANNLNGISETAGAATLTNTISANNGGSDISTPGGGTITGTHNLIDDASFGTLTGGSSNINAPALLGPLGAYGSTNGTQTLPLLPGSPAINAGTSTGAPATDQRGISRPQLGVVDIGAFESQGFTFSTPTGTPQSALINTPFTTPLGVTVTANAPIEPVDGGQVTFTATPAITGASATLATSPATISSGTVSVIATANSTAGGPYSVTPSANGVSGAATYSLTNTPPAGTLSLVVTNTNETAAADANCVVGNCSLRQAVNASNANDPGVGNHNAITFTAGLNGTVMLTNGTLGLAQSVTIDGNGATITVDGKNAVSVFGVNSGVTAAITALTIQHGLGSSDGGGIFNNGGTVTVTNSTFFANAGPGGGGGIANISGTLTVTNSTFTTNSASNGPGGGIANFSGTVTVTNSTFSGNSASTVGGGIGNQGTLTVTNSTLTGNASSNFGGGIFTNSSATVTNTLVAGNTAPSGQGPDASGAFTSDGGNLIGISGAGSGNSGFTQATDQTGTVATPLNPLLGTLGAYGSTNGTQTLPLLPGSPAIDKGIVAGAPATDQRGKPRLGLPDIGAFESQGFTIANLTGTPRSALINTAFAAPLGVTIAANNPVEPVDGGQVIFTVTPVGGASATLATSPATISGGTASVTATANGTVGGPYLVTPSASGVSGTATFALKNTAPAAPISLVVTNTNETAAVDATCAIGNCSLRQAVNASNANDPGAGNHNTITFTNGLTGTLTLMNGTLTLTRSVTIDGTGATITVDGGCLGCQPNGTPSGGTQIFRANGVTATFIALTLQHGHTNQNGAAISGVDSVVTVMNCTLTENNDIDHGGGLAFTTSGQIGGSLLITNSTFNGNTVGSGAAGAAIYVNTLHPVSIISSTFANNGGGVGVIYTAFPLTLTNTIVAHTTSASDLSGSFTGTNNLIDDGSISNLSGTGNINAPALLGTLGAYGGTNGTQTFPLLPGSPAINAGTSTGAPATDQRGVSRPQLGVVDIGAFESQGFTFANPTGTPQSTAVSTQFVTPLGVTVTANAAIEPVDGGQIIFAVTPVGGATASLATSPATISGGKANVTATANGIAGGPYTVTPSASGVSGTATFSLTNTRGPVTSITLTGPGGATTLTLKVGETVQLTATATYADHSTQVLPAVQLVWQSGDSAKVAVDANGSATGLSAGGPVTVTVTQGGVTGQIAVTVATPVLTGVQPAPAPASRPSGANAPTVGSPTPAPLPSGPAPGGAGPAPNPNPTGR